MGRPCWGARGGAHELGVVGSVEPLRAVAGIGGGRQHGCCVANARARLTPACGPHHRAQALPAARICQV